MRVGEVDSCRVHFVELLALAGDPVGQVDDVENLGAAEAGDLHGTHAMRLGAATSLVLVDRGVTAAAARELGRRHGVEVRRVGWDEKQPVFRPIRHAWRVEVAHARLGRARRLAKSFENTTTSATGWLQVACIATTLRHLSALRGRPRPVPAAA
jgi:putative transposase